MPNETESQSQLSKDSERALRTLNKTYKTIETNLLDITTELESEDRDIDVCLAFIDDVLILIDEFRKSEREHYDESAPQSFNKGFGLFKTATQMKIKLERLKKDQHVVTNNVQSPAQAKLPDIQLPSFSGDCNEWYSFRDSFNSLIGNNNSLSNLEKFQYLKSSLTGEAAKTVKSLEITGLNYPIAIQLLCDSFENKRLIVNSHIQALFDMPYIKKETSQEYRELINAVTQNTSALEVLDRPINNTEDWLIHLIVSRCPYSIQIKWENQLNNSEMPSLEDLKQFLTKRCQTLQTVNHSENSKSKNNLSHSHNSNMNQSCIVCFQPHQLFSCDKFRSLELNKRSDLVRSKRLCRNCLKPGHNIIDCKSSKTCKICHKKHNTLLHFPNTNQNQCQGNLPGTSSSLYVNSSENDHVLLSTCVVEVHMGNNKQNIRALLDSGSQSNLISTKAAQRLKLKHIKTNQTFSGLGSNNCFVHSYVNINFSSLVNKFHTNINCFVIDKITNQLPAQTLNIKQIQIPDGIQLADPKFYESADIDLLIGAELFYDLLTAERLHNNKLTFQNSKLGWIVSGKVPSAQPVKNLACHSVTFSQLNNSIVRFWQVEHFENNKAILSKEKHLCEEIFAKTVERDCERRFVVVLPWKINPSVLGNSYGMAKKRLINLENKLQNNPNLKQEYHSFINEYIALGHMKQISYNQNEFNYYLPHHAIIKNSSLTTKLRVVFDASAKSSNNLSLNEILLTGPSLQEDLFDILLRFRMHEYVITADIQMMYRQIKIKESDCKYQQILWRESPNKPIKTYQLKSVTYGTCCAPYLAVKCLQELSKEADNELTSHAILHDFYMDDLLTGAPTIGAAKQLRDSLIKTLKLGGMSLRKWAANDPEIVGDLNNKYISNHVLNLTPQEQIKTLGIQWNPINDKIEYNPFKLDVVSTTKRTILSEISKYFDPLGLLGPVIVKAKLIIQNIWKHKLNWDERVPQDILQSWLELRDQLNSMKTIKIPRKVKSSFNSSIEIHAFGDASMNAYGSAVYLKSIESNGSIFCELLCAKSRVAPLKVITLPRLELCAAVLTANLVQHVKTALSVESVKCFYYTDSTIVLSWINSDPAKFKQFVSHRVGEIQRLSNITHWQHIRSADNPADVISRGALPSELIKNLLWWNGPECLKHPWSPRVFIPNNNPNTELRSLINTTSRPHIPWLNKYSSLIKLIRVTAWIQRFINNSSIRKTKLIGELNTDELNTAEIKILKSVQQAEFSKEIKLLKNNQPLDSSSNLLQLNPFIDEFGIVRVGGRLRHSKLEYDAKFPIILPKHSHLNELIIRYYHKLNFHIGTQGTLASVRTKYWPIAGKNSVKKVIRKCVVCFRANPQSTQPIMGNLPEYRATQLLPFKKTGIDYAGPFMIKEGKRKAAKLIKIYIALFVCMATKAVHIEIVSDLTTDSFLAALRRFMSRRGFVSDLYSDNATNFVGANNEIKKLYNFLSDQQDAFKSALSINKINWHFIPPRAPHFGGLWEAGIKSTKRLLFKVVGNANLTYEEFLTLSNQIEAILNSRPLYPLSHDPNDFSFLTPGHFLIGGNLRALPEPDLEEINIGRLSRWQLVQRIQQQFWKKWNKEYLQELQGRRKWKRSNGNPLEVGQLVLIHEDNTPPCRWRVGRVEAVHPGPDKVVRAATVKTARESFVRPVVKLCAFPNE